MRVEKRESEREFMSRSNENKGCMRVEKSMRVDERSTLILRMTGAFAFPESQ